MIKKDNCVNELDIEKIVLDFQRGYKELEDLGPSVTFFGSARFKEENPYCVDACELAFRLGKKGYTIITGGSNGIMKASNKGAFESKGSESIGLNIKLPREQMPNPYTTKNLTFDYFFARKAMLIQYSLACVVFPGGFGTLDELFEALTLMQTGKNRKIAIFLYGKEYWEKLYDFMKTTMVEHKTICSQDVDLMILTDDLDDIVKRIDKQLATYIEELQKEGLINSDCYKKALELLER